MNIYDQITGMSREARLCLCRFALRDIRLGYEDKCRLLGRVPRIDQERESKTDNESMKVTT
jgi:hypothetical protein